MKYLNVLDNIGANDIIAMRIDTSNQDLPTFIIETNDKGIVVENLDEGFKVHRCNEFLRSLNLVSDIQFTTYVAYDRTVKFLNKLLVIRKVMEEVSSVPYDDIGYSAQQVYQVILNCLLSKHRMASKGWNEAMNRRPLKDWVAEALAVIS